MLFQRVGGRVCVCVRVSVCPLRAGLAQSHSGLKCNFIQSYKLGFFYCANLHFAKQNEVCH